MRDGGRCKWAVDDWQQLAGNLAGDARTDCRAGMHMCRQPTPALPARSSHLIIRLRLTPGPLGVMSPPPRFRRCWCYRCTGCYHLCAGRSCWGWGCWAATAAEPCCCGGGQLPGKGPKHRGVREGSLTIIAGPWLLLLPLLHRGAAGLLALPGWRGGTAVHAQPVLGVGLAKQGHLWRGCRSVSLRVAGRLHKPLLAAP